ncbi:acyl-CoA-binding domain-containing protein 4 isoform X3 [Neoarius graeffei]|uniref:acyl-CoA-binding domain-containing protein 4 isoform X3 n=1 Tax=Neoarius graeffei TaxID=443677 RepID=UPI00298D3329|nr:acyl-CoA-binding domain-containing protein 4 isoform X3 [Neoarius graeffei]
MCLATAAGFRVSARFLSVVLTSCRPQALLMEIQVAHLPPSKSEECQRRFQAAVDVIQNLPKNGSYRPSYEVMLRFYSLYKQAVCGPCTTSRPGFWDPVGRYKWDAWNRLGNMSRESAMAAYVDEMKKVAQEVIDNMAINEKTASFYHYFEPLYHVIHDLPRPPEALLSLRQDMALSDGLVLTSDSESEIFCDSVEQLDCVKQPVPEPYNKQNWHVNYTPALQVTQLGAGQGGEGAGNGPPPKKREQGRDGMRHGWREAPGGVLYNSGRRAGQQASGGGGHNPERGTERLQDIQVQEQIILALQRLREDMQSVMERLEVVEGLAAAYAHNSQWRHMQLTSPQTEVEKWWPFDVSGRTLLLLLIWPFIAQGMIFWLRQRKKKPQNRVCL